MENGKQVVALAGVGAVGKYLCEELLASDRFDVVVLSRSKQKAWFSTRNIPVHQTDYSDRESLINILDSTHAAALISFIQLAGSTYIDIHRTLIAACLQSTTCKRFIPSEWIGNLDSFPEKPKFYHESREPIRELLRQTKGLQWTLVNQGFFMDYFLKADKTYLAPIPDEFPVDPNGWKVCIRGTGEEMQTFTMARDVAKAVVELLGADEWEPVTYVAGEWTTFNKAIEILEKFYGRPLPRTNISLDQIQRNLIEHENGSDPDKYVISQVDDWMVSGGCALPRPKTLRQREKYFGTLNFVTLLEVLERAEKVQFP